MTEALKQLVANDLSISTIKRMEYFADVHCVYCTNIEFKLIKDDTVDQKIVEHLTKVMKDIWVVSEDSRCSTVTGWLNKDKVFIEIYKNSNRGEDAYGAQNLDIYIYGSADAISTLSTLLTAKLETEAMALVKWWYQGDRGPETKLVLLPPLTTTLHQEFYPDTPNVSAYLDKYLASDAAILMLAGDPGTGKTTLLRHLISDYKLEAHVVYDENLMRSDSVFQQFLFGKDADIMIIEDADTILTSRETDGNKLMSRFLNISDGLIKLPNKKLVFTTNLSDFGRVDSALLRPGRCFGVIHTRALDLAESQAACKVAKLPIPTEKRTYTLAELFNQGYRHETRSIGFRR